MKAVLKNTKNRSNIFTFKIKSYNWLLNERKKTLQKNNPQLSTNMKKREKFYLTFGLLLQFSDPYTRGTEIVGVSHS